MRRERVLTVKGSIITKLIIVCVVILIVLGGIVAANLLSFHNIQRVLVSIIDRDVNAVIENARLGREISQVFAETHLLMSTFIDQQESVNTAGDRLLEALRYTMPDADANGTELLLLQEFTQRLQTLLQQCSIVNDLSQTIETLYQEIAVTLNALEDTVAQKMITMIMQENDEKIFEIEQLSTMIPGYHDLLSQMAIVLMEIKHAYLAEEEIEGDEVRKQQFVALLEQFNTDLAIVTKTGEDFAEYGERIRAVITRYNREFETFYQALEEFQIQVSDLNAAQEELFVEIQKIDNQVAQTTSRIRAEAISEIQSSRNLIVYLSMVILAVLIGVGYYTFRLMNPIKDLAYTAALLAQGDITCQPPAPRTHDEIGILSRAFKNLMSYIQDMAAAATEIARGNVSKDIRPQSERDVLGNAFREMSSYLHDMAHVAAAIAAGDLTKTVQVRSNTDVFGRMIQMMTEGLHTLIIQIRSSAEKITSTGTTIASLSAGDIELVEHVNDSMKHVVATMNEMSTSVETVAHNMETLSSSVEETSTSVSQMASTVASIASNTATLNKQTQKMGNSLDDSVQTLQEVVKSTATSQQLAQETIQNALEGQQAIEQVVTSMNTIEQTVRKAVDTITRFELHSREIDTVLKVIRDITDQTSLLALNASIIAAQAGVHGRGFAVVAEEIKNLANGVGVSTKDIAKIVSTLQEETMQVVQAIHTGAEHVEQGIDHTQHARDTLEKIFSSAQRSSSMVTDFTEVLHGLMESSSNVSREMEQVRKMTDEITLATAEHQAGASQINQAIEHINARASQIQSSTDQQSIGIHQVLEAAHNVVLLADQNLQSSQKISKTSEVLTSQAELLLHAVGRFKLKKNNSPL